MGDVYIERHPWGSEDWFVSHQRGFLKVLRKGGVEIGNYDPLVMD